MDFFIDQNIVRNENESPLIKIHNIEKKKKKENKNIQKEDSDENSPFAKLKNYNNDKIKIQDNDEKEKTNEKIKNIITNDENFEGEFMIPESGVIYSLD